MRDEAERALPADRVLALLVVAQSDLGAAVRELALLAGACPVQRCAENLLRQRHVLRDRVRPGDVRCAERAVDRDEPVVDRPARLRSTGLVVAGGAGALLRAHRHERARLEQPPAADALGVQEAAVEPRPDRVVAVVGAALVAAAGPEEVVHLLAPAALMAARVDDLALPVEMDVAPAVAPPERRRFAVVPRALFALGPTVRVGLVELVGVVAGCGCAGP